MSTVLFTEEYVGTITFTVSERKDVSDIDDTRVVSLDVYYVSAKNGTRTIMVHDVRTKKEYEIDDLTFHQ